MGTGRIACTVALISLCYSAATAQTGTPAAQDCQELPALKQRLTSAEARLSDWAQLGRYREANTKVAPRAPNEERVVFMGDSITDFWGRGDQSQFFPGKPYMNRGISGQTTPQMLIRFRPDVIALGPEVVVVLAGTNDIAGNTGPSTLTVIEDNLSSMAELAHSHGIRVVLASLLPVSDYGHNRDGKPVNQTTRRPPAQILALNDWIKKYAAAGGMTYLDYYSGMVDDKGMLKQELSDDGLHPNAKGYAVMMPLAQQAISTAVKGKH
jgi:lysophospholipase L1-like esterase